MINLSCSLADFAGTVVGGQKICVSLADKFKFCKATFYGITTIEEIF